MGSTVDGLVSGLDTTTIINQLMSIQAVPQTRLKTTLSTTQGQLTGLQNVNTGMTALQKAAEAMTKATAWNPVATSSSSTAVTATATAGATTGSTRFSVTALAQGQSSVSAATYTSLTDTTAFAAGQSFEIHSGATSSTVSSSTGSLQSLVDSINATATGVSATAVKVGDGLYRLQLTSTTQGASSAFSVSGPAGDAATGLPLTTVTKPSDAKVHVGDADAGYDVTSSSNTIEGLLPGLTVKLTGVATDVTVSTTRDDAAVTAAAKALVDAANSVLGTLKAVTTGGTVGADGKRTGAGVLSSDPSIKALSQSIIAAVAGGSGGTSFSAVGISTTREGTLKFDDKAFAAALAKDPAGTRALFSNATLGTDATGSTPAVAATAGSGVADLVNRISKAASGSTGSISSSISGRNTQISDLTRRIGDWDTRLASQKDALSKQYASLETALGKLKNQSTWLAGQLNSLPSYNNSGN